MSENEGKAYKELLATGEEITRVFQTAYGPVEFVLRIPSWMTLAKIGSNNAVIDAGTGQVNYDMAQEKRERLKACIVKHPFPPEEYEVCLDNLAPDIARVLLETIDNEVKKSREISKK